MHDPLSTIFDLTTEDERQQIYNYFENEMITYCNNKTLQDIQIKQDYKQKLEQIGFGDL